MAAIRDSNSQSQFPAAARKKKAAKSYLIDTVVRGLPIPIIFIRERPNLETLVADREVVDGQQRLRTLLSFIDPKCLKDFKEEHDAFVVQKLHNPEIAGQTFSGCLPPSSSPFSGMSLACISCRQTLTTSRCFRFLRVEFDGVRLKSQELRNARFFGLFKGLMYDLAYEQLSRWRPWEIYRARNCSHG